MPLKKLMGIQPTYVGAWNRGRFDGLPDTFDEKRICETEASLFYISITSEEGNNFTGVSRDFRGIAKIKGSKLSTLIKFTKQYDEQAVAKGGRRAPTTYTAVRVVQEQSPEEREFFAGLITSKGSNPLPFIMKTLL
jgi:hypothetical protein